jgi:hypothetical protein
MSKSKIKPCFSVAISLNTLALKALFSTKIVYTGLDAPSLALIKRLDLAMKVMEGEETAVDDFAAELLRAMGYETEDTVVRTRKNIRLTMCGELVFAKTDVCLLDVNSEIFLLVQEDKTHINPSDPEAQLIAEAIGAFQENNAKRVNELFLKPLQTQTIQGITMVGTFPRFYKITVTADLDRCVRFGEYPTARLSFIATLLVYQGDAAMG